MRFTDRMHRVAAFGFVAGLATYIGLQLQVPQETGFRDIGVGALVGVAVTILLALTRLGRE